MPAEPPITTQATIVTVIDPFTYTAELPNGKIVHAHLSRRREPGDFTAGESVTLQMNPYDFSRARICPKNEPTDEPAP